MEPQKMMPQNIEAEQATIGSAIIDPEVFVQLAWLPVEDFYRNAHQHIWSAGLDLVRRGIPADLITLCNELEARGQLERAGGAAYISSLANAAPSHMNADHYADIVSRVALARRVVKVSAELVKIAYTDIEHDAGVFRDKVLQLVMEATAEHAPGHIATLDEVLQVLQEETYARMEGDLTAHMLLTGYPSLDRLVVGLEPGDLVFAAARPRMGKSCFGQGLLLEAARQVKPLGGTCDYVTLEMTSVQQGRRMVAARARINSQAIRSGFRDRSRPDSEPDVDQWTLFCEAVDSLRKELGQVIYVDEDGMTVDQLRTHLIGAVASRKCKFVLVDQLDLFEGDNRQTEQEQVGKISKALKQIAKELQIVIVCLVQLNRSLENRSGAERRPRLSDLRMSGRLEQDADMVWFIHRPCIYQPKHPNPHWDEYAELWAAKLREGASGEMVPMRFTAPFTSFSAWPEDWRLPMIADEEPENGKGGTNGH